MKNKIMEQLGILEQEIDSVKKDEVRINARVSYIDLLIKMKEEDLTYEQIEQEVSAPKDNSSAEEITKEDVVDSIVETEPEEPEVELEEEPVEEPPSVTAETEAVLPEEDNDDEIQEVVWAKDSEDNDIDVSDAYYYVYGETKDTELALDIAAWVTEYDLLISYKEFAHLTHGVGREYIAYTLSEYGMDDFREKVKEFSGLKKEFTAEQAINFITDDNAVSVYCFAFDLSEDDV